VIDWIETTVLVWLWLSIKGHVVTLLPLPPLEWGEEWIEKGKKLWVGVRAV